MSIRTPICDLFGIDVPIVQTGMGWVAGPRLVSASSNAGALGILASATMTYDELVGAVAASTRPSFTNCRVAVPSVTSICFDQ